MLSIGQSAKFARRTLNFYALNANRFQHMKYNKTKTLMKEKLLEIFETEYTARTFVSALRRLIWYPNKDIPKLTHPCVNISIFPAVNHITADCFTTRDESFRFNLRETARTAGRSAHLR